MKDFVQKFTFFYAAIFFIVVALGYVPGFTDENDLLFGLFHIDPIDDVIHLTSAVWAFFAAKHSTKASVIYLKLFGTIYLLDGLFGMAFGKGFLDFAIFTSVPGIVELGTRIAANIPHVVIGGLAVVIGLKSKTKKS